MSDWVADTHALIWHLMSSPLLSAAARSCFQDADQGMARIYVPAICIVEVVYLSERGRVSTELVQQVFQLSSIQSGSYALCPLDLTVLATVSAVPRQQVPEMPDRLIVATALSLGLPLVTNDQVIHASAVVPVVW
jgi:PIN domain nuclease of toxin-antitoxin system